MAWELGLDSALASGFADVGYFFLPYTFNGLGVTGYLLAGLGATVVFAAYVMIVRN